MTWVSEPFRENLGYHLLQNVVYKSTTARFYSSKTKREKERKLHKNK